MSAQRLNAIIASKSVDRELSLEDVDHINSSTGFFVDAGELAALERTQQQLERDALTLSAADAVNKLLGTSINTGAMRSSPAARATLGAFIERNRDTSASTLGAKLARFADSVIDKLR